MLLRPVHCAVFALAMVLLGGLAGCTPAHSREDASGAVPAPTVDAPLAAQADTRSAVFAGGCFWGMQWVFEHVRGVEDVTSGYAGGAADTAHYARVSAGNTGHAESVRVRYDPSRVSYGQLLRIYFSVATDPTERDRQGPDVGAQYRSVLFVADPQQQRIAEAYIRQLGSAGAFDAPIVTRVVPLKGFYPAEEYHQDYARLHPHALYIVVNDAPRISRFRKQLPDLFREHPVHHRP